jgi:hypothetical protein
MECRCRFGTCFADVKSHSPFHDLKSTSHGSQVHFVYDSYIVLLASVTVYLLSSSPSQETPGCWLLRVSISCLHLRAASIPSVGSAKTKMTTSTCLSAWNRTKPHAVKTFLCQMCLYRIFLDTFMRGLADHSQCCRNRLHQLLAFHMMLQYIDGQFADGTGIVQPNGKNFRNHRKCITVADMQTSKVL